MRYILVGPRRYHATWKSQSRKATYWIIQFITNVWVRQILNIEKKIEPWSSGAGMRELGVKQGEVSADGHGVPSGGNENFPEVIATMFAQSVNMREATEVFSEHV